MKKIIVDSTVVIKWLNTHKEEDIDKADKLLEDVKSGKAELFAPEILKYEIGKTLYYSKKLTQLESKVALDAFFHLPVKYTVLDRELAKESHAIASAYDVSYAESVYLALAERENAYYLTVRAGENTKSSGIKVVELKDY